MIFSIFRQSSLEILILRAFKNHPILDQVISLLSFPILIVMLPERVVD
jgi:hypothetical protein